MKRILTILTIVASVAAVLATSATSAGASERADRTYRITITNDTVAQPFTPPNFASHGRTRLFGFGRQATPGIQAVAENGMPGVLAAEWDDLGLDNTVALPQAGSPPPIFPGESRTFEFTTNDRRFSLVTMIICTNDGFGGVNSRRLPARMGETTNDRIRAFDAGTEINTQRDADFVDVPFCGEPGVGTFETNPDLAENGRIRGHRGIRRGVGDIPQRYDFDRFVGEVEITRIG